MKVWRLCRARHSPTAFDGEGARLYGGRWNHKGLPVVYASATLSLAVLEVLVHHRVPIPPHEFVALTAEIPVRLKLETVSVQDLPADWRADPAPVRLQEIGSEWLQRASSLVLAVPSALIEQEFNYLINPRHSDFAHLSINAPIAFSFDGRLWH